MIYLPYILLGIYLGFMPIFHKALFIDRSHNWLQSTIWISVIVWPAIIGYAIISQLWDMLTGESNG